jgi:3,4-dihydroxy 2-butanone 4-phosphate synthase
MSKNTELRSSGQHSPLDRAVSAFAAGDPVLVFDADDREGETDLIYPARSVAPRDVARLRNDAGGLVCVALDSDVADAFDLPFLEDQLGHATATNRPAYDDRSSFSLPVNHRDTYTGITDEDRALTINRLAAAARDPAGFDFAAEFRAPGHVHLLRAADGLLADRRGHTELGIALAAEAGTAPAVVVCEMLDDESGTAMSRAGARAYADRHDLAFLTGRQLLAGLDGS